MNKKTNIVLIGMRGTGKTTVGRLLSEKLQKQFIETDRLIEERVGMEIAQIVAKNGWEDFRKKEAEVIASLASKENCVISCGGGVVINDENIKLVQKHGVLFLLLASINTMLSRIGDDQNRPSLLGKTSRRADMEEVWLNRRKLYYNAAQEAIDTEKLTPEEVASKITQIWEEKYA